MLQQPVEGRGMAPGLGCRCAWWPRCCHLPLPQALCAPVVRWASPPVILSLSCRPGREGSTLGSTLGCREMSSELCQPLAQTVPAPRDPTCGRTQLEGGGLGADTPFHLEPSSPPQSHLQHAPGTARPGGGHLRDMSKGCPRSPQHLVPRGRGAAASSASSCSAGRGRMARASQARSQHLAHLAGSGCAGWGRQPGAAER